LPLNPASVYRQTSVATASQGRLVTMLYDRLVRDLEEAVLAIGDRRPAAAHIALVHAQDIVTMLRDSLDLTAWPDGASLKDLYDYVLDELVQGNLAKDVKRLRNCLMVVQPLAEAWHEAFRRAGDVVAR
jgi:flagellar secretion chaperone FliS